MINRFPIIVISAMNNYIIIYIMTIFDEFRLLIHWTLETIFQPGIFLHSVDG